MRTCGRLHPCPIDAKESVHTVHTVPKPSVNVQDHLTLTKPIKGSIGRYFHSPTRQQQSHHSAIEQCLGHLAQALRIPSSPSHTIPHFNIAASTAQTFSTTVMSTYCVLSLLLLIHSSLLVSAKSFIIRGMCPEKVPPRARAGNSCGIPDFVDPSIFGDNADTTGTLRALSRSRGLDLTITLTKLPKPDLVLTAWIIWTPFGETDPPSSKSPTTLRPAPRTPRSLVLGSRENPTNSDTFRRRRPCSRPRSILIQRTLGRAHSRDHYFVIFFPLDKPIGKFTVST